jgi:hypothetical protein
VFVRGERVGVGLHMAKTQLLWIYEFEAAIRISDGS